VALMRAFAASFLIVFSVLSEVAFVAFRGLPAPVVTVLLVLGATLGICLAVSSAARNVSPAAFAASSIALAVFAARWLSLTSLAVSLISFAVSLVAAASCTASASSVIAPLSRNYFTVSLAVEDTSRIVIATPTSFTLSAACSGVISLDTLCPRARTRFEEFNLCNYIVSSLKT